MPGTESDIRSVHSVSRTSELLYTIISYEALQLVCFPQKQIGPSGSGRNHGLNVLNPCYYSFYDYYHSVKRIH